MRSRLELLSSKVSIRIRISNHHKNCTLLTGRDIGLHPLSSTVCYWGYVTNYLFPDIYRSNFLIRICPKYESLFRMSYVYTRENKSAECDRNSGGKSRFKRIVNWPYEASTHKSAKWLVTLTFWLKINGF